MKVLSSRFHENLSSESSAVLFGWTDMQMDKHDEANRRLSRPTHVRKP